MSCEDPPQNDSGRGDPASGRGALIFVLAGPIVGVLIVLAIMTATTGGPSDAYGYPVVFVFSLLMCAAIAPLDDLLAREVSLDVRMILTAIAGAAVTVGANLLVWFPPPEVLLLFAAVGALTTGTCSLLAYCLLRRKA